MTVPVNSKRHRITNPFTALPDEVARITIRYVGARVRALACADKYLLRLCQPALKEMRLLAQIDRIEPMQTATDNYFEDYTLVNIGPARAAFETQLKEFLASDALPGTDSMQNILVKFAEKLIELEYHIRTYRSNFNVEWILRGTSNVEGQTWVRKQSHLLLHATQQQLSPAWRAPVLLPLKRIADFDTDSALRTAVAGELQLIPAADANRVRLEAAQKIKKDTLPANWESEKLAECGRRLSELDAMPREFHASELVKLCEFLKQVPFAQQEVSVGMLARYFDLPRKLRAEANEALIKLIDQAHFLEDGLLKDEESSVFALLGEFRASDDTLEGQAVSHAIRLASLLGPENRKAVLPRLVKLMLSLPASTLGKVAKALIEQLDQINRLPKRTTRAPLFQFHRELIGCLLTSRAKIGADFTSAESQALSKRCGDLIGQQVWATHGEASQHKLSFLLAVCAKLAITEQLPGLLSTSFSETLITTKIDFARDMNEALLIHFESAKQIADRHFRTMQPVLMFQLNFFRDIPFAKLKSAHLRASSLLMGQMADLCLRAPMTRLGPLPAALGKAATHAYFDSHFALLLKRIDLLPSERKLPWLSALAAAAHDIRTPGFAQSVLNNTMKQAKALPQFENETKGTLLAAMAGQMREAWSTRFAKVLCAKAAKLPERDKAGLLNALADALVFYSTTPAAMARPEAKEELRRASQSLIKQINKIKHLELEAQTALLEKLERFSPKPD